MTPTYQPANGRVAGTLNCYDCCSTCIDGYEGGDEVFLKPFGRDAPHLDQAVAPTRSQVVGAERIPL